MIIDPHLGFGRRPLRPSVVATYAGTGPALVQRQVGQEYDRWSRAMIIGPQPRPAEVDETTVQVPTEVGDWQLRRLRD